MPESKTNIELVSEWCSIRFAKKIKAGERDPFKALDETIKEFGNKYSFISTSAVYKILAIRGLIKVG